MATLEERVVSIEARVGEHNQMMTGMRDAVAGLDRRMAAFEERVDRRFAATDARLEGLNARMTSHFMWLVGIQISILLAIIAALSTR